jgi:IclR family acetate operon transcriptional repressor
MWAMAIGKTGLRGLARPNMEAIAAESSETVSLHIRDGLHRICIDSVEGIHPVRRVVPIGERLPLTAGPTGKTMLAFLPTETIEQAIDAVGARGDERAAIERDLEEVRRKGYLVRVSDRIEGVGGLSVPVFDATGIAAVVTTSGPERRFSKGVMEALAPFVVDKCEELSAVLGHIATDAAVRNGDRLAVATDGQELRAR